MKFVKAIVALLIVLLVAAFATGLLSPRKTMNQLRVASSQAAAGVGTPSVNLSSGPPAPREVEMAKTCCANLRAIETAKKKVAEASGMTMGDASQPAVLKQLGGKMPVCPKGGTYTIGSNTQMPRCSIAANGTVDATDDHFLVNF